MSPAARKARIIHQSGRDQSGYAPGFPRPVSRALQRAADRRDSTAMRAVELTEAERVAHENATELAGRETDENWKIDRLARGQ